MKKEIKKLNRQLEKMETVIIIFMDYWHASSVTGSKAGYLYTSMNQLQEHYLDISNAISSNGIFLRKQYKHCMLHLDSIYNILHTMRDYSGSDRDIVDLLEKRFRKIEKHMAAIRKEGLGK